MMSTTAAGAARSDDQKTRHAQYLSTGGGYSEDSDYTSDLNYPVPGQNPNSSASQYVNLKQPLHQQPMVNAMANSYDYQTEGGYYDDGSGMGGYNSYGQAGVVPDGTYAGGDYDQDELFYNSRPPK